MIFPGPTHHDQQEVMMSETTTHIPAAPGTPCGFWRSHGPNGGAGCESGPDRSPARAVHVLTEDLPVAPAGTPLCAFHSPYAVRYRYDVKLTPDSVKGRTVHTFTWGVTRGEAYARVARMMDRPEWSGWSFDVADAPDPNIWA
jgi:hypothetical protein